MNHAQQAQSGIWRAMPLYGAGGEVRPIGWLQIN